MFIKYLFDVLGNCSDEDWKMPRYEAPGGVPSVTTNVKAKRDDSGQFVPIINLTWIQLSDSKADDVQLCSKPQYLKNNQIISVKLFFCTKHVHLAQLVSQHNSI